MPGTATDIALVSLSGELDLYEVGPLKDALAAADKLDPHAVVVDLSGVSFLGTGPRGEFHLGITPGKCSDGMSDRSYDHASTFIYGGTTYTGCAEQR